MKTTGLLALAACVALAGVNGCGQKKKPQAVATTIPVHPVMAGTIAEYASLYGGNETIVRGYGLVVGLGQNGSSEVPPAIRKLIADRINKYKLLGDTPLTANRLMDDLDTAVVVVSTAIPPGVPKGTPLDCMVQALPQTQTRSLEGGTLLTTDMSAVAVRDNVARESHELAMVRGQVFVNPFSDEQADAASKRQGRIIGGGIVTESRPVRLVLYHPDSALASEMEKRINARFGSSTKTAKGMNASFVELEIPREYRKDFRHFLDLVSHLYIPRGGGAEEQKARFLAEVILQPDAPAEDISLLWEAMGRQVLPLVRDLYGSDNESARYHAARAGARLEDYTAYEVLIQTARKTGSPFRMAAISELGMIDNVSVVSALRDLLSDEDAQVRVKAYEALARHEVPRGGIERIDIDGQFEIDVVPTGQEHVIYASVADRPRLVLFGQNIPVARPVFYSSPDAQVTIHAQPADKTIQVFRRVGAEGPISDQFQIEPDVKSLVQTMGHIPNEDPDGKIAGLGLTYSQVTGAMYRLCNSHAIRAKFVLQALPESQRIYDGNTPTGRPEIDEGT